MSPLPSLANGENLLGKLCSFNLFKKLGIKDLELMSCFQILKYLIEVEQTLVMTSIAWIYKSVPLYFFQVKLKKKKSKIQTFLFIFLIT